MNIKNACIIVTYRKPHLLQKCIQGVIGQTHQPNYIVIVDNNRLCYDMIDLYQKDGIVTEPAGCLSISALMKINSHELQKNSCFRTLLIDNNYLTS